MDENTDTQNLKNISEHMCRICSNISEFLIPIYEGEGVEQQLELKIQKHLPVKVHVEDALPLQLCYQCAATLIAWDSLITACLETDKKLRALLKVENDSEVILNEHEEDNDIGVDLDSDDEPLITQAKKIDESKREKKEMPQDTVKKSSKSKRVKSIPKKIIQKDAPEKDIKQTDVSSEAVWGHFVEANIKTEIIDEDYERNLQIVEKTDGTEKVKCEFCHKSYKAVKHLQRHIKKYHKNEGADTSYVQKCNICGNVYKTKTNLKRHYMSQHVANQVECPVCHNSISSKKLDNHLKTVHGVKTEQEEEDKYPCKYCLKLFKNKYIRNSHVREAHLDEPIKCKLCGFEGVRTVVKRHKREVHCERKYPCSVCGVPFKTLHTLKMHMITHSDLRSYTCDVCGMGFKRLNNVRDHMKCHEQKSNQCQICGNFFARKRYLAIHEKTIHNFYADGVVPEEKGFECGICGAKLKWKKNLLAHMRIHSGEKPYVCKICKKDFICHGSLRSHMAKHGVYAVVDKSSESLLSSPLSQPEFHTLHPQLTVEMHCY